MSTQLQKITQLKWRAFLATEAGIEGMLILREKTPSITKAQPHEIAFDAGIATGYKKCLDHISDMLGAAPEKKEDFENK